MKKIILSVAAATMAFSTSAMAIENVKADGLVKAIYQTTDNDRANTDFGERAGAQAQVGVSAMLSADLSTNLAGAVEVAAVTTLGLENGLVSNTMATRQGTNVGASGAAANNGEFQTDDQFWISQAYITYNMGKTTLKAGLQELNTPLVFTEKWNVAKNTFQSIVLVNNDIENVTLVGAYVGKHNGAQDQGTVTYDGRFNTFGAKGAYAFGAVAKVDSLNLQGWYYNVNTAAEAFWLEADTKVAGVFVGAQFANMDPDGASDNNAYAFKVGADVAGVHVYGAYSDVEDGAGSFANVSTGDKTKLYTGTASIYGDGGRAAQADTKGWKLGASAKVAGIALGAAYSDYDMDTNNGTRAQQDHEVIDFSAATKVGPVALKAIYTNWQTDTAGVETRDLDTIRVIAGRGC